MRTLRSKLLLGNKPNTTELISDRQERASCLDVAFITTYFQCRELSNGIPHPHGGKQPRSYHQAALPPREQKGSDGKTSKQRKYCEISRRLGLAWAKTNTRKEASGAFQLGDTTHEQKRTLTQSTLGAGRGPSEADLPPARAATTASTCAIGANINNKTSRLRIELKRCTRRKQHPQVSD